jgi:hypothetical protein
MPYGLEAGPGQSSMTLPGNGMVVLEYWSVGVLEYWNNRASKSAKLQITMT